MLALDWWRWNCDCFQRTLAKSAISVCTAGRRGLNFADAFMGLEVKPDEFGRGESVDRYACQVSVRPNPPMIVGASDSKSTLPGLDIAENKITLLNKEGLLPTQLCANQVRLVESPPTKRTPSSG